MGRRLDEQQIQDAMRATIEAWQPAVPVGAWQGISVSGNATTGFSVATVRTLNGSSRQRTQRIDAAAEGGMTAESRTALDIQIRRHVRRLRRRAACGPALDVEPWTFTMHRLLRAWLLWKNVDPMLLVTQKMGDDSMRTIVVDHVMRAAGLEIGRVAIEDGRVDIATIRNAESETQLTGNGRPVLMIDGSMPLQVAMSLPGRLLSEVVDHPAVRREGPIRIELVEVLPDAPEMIVIVLEDVQDFVRRPPKGFDRSWARIPFDPRPND